MVLVLKKGASKKEMLTISKKQKKQRCKHQEVLRCY